MLGDEKSPLFPDIIALANSSFPPCPSVQISSSICLVDGCLLVELKAVLDVLPIHKAQLLSYMKLLDVPLGLLLNFHELKLVDGLSRLLLSGANLP